MKHTPLISVIIPVYNCEKYLAEAIESVLSQCYPSLEVIIVDDGSTDSSAEVAAQFLPKVKYQFRENSGPSTALNQGIKLSQGDFLAFLDSDDIWELGKLTAQMHVFSENPEYDAVFGYIQQFKSPELDWESHQKILIDQEIMPGYHKGTMLIKRSSFNRVGQFNPQMKFVDFIDWFARAKEKELKMFMMKDVLMRRRLHKTNMGVREKASRLEYVRILKASLDRRRALQGMLSNDLESSRRAKHSG